MKVILLYWFATQQQTSTFRREKFDLFYSKFSAKTYICVLIRSLTVSLLLILLVLDEERVLLKKLSLLLSLILPLL